VTTEDGSALATVPTTISRAVSVVDRHRSTSKSQNISSTMMRRSLSLV